MCGCASWTIKQAEHRRIDVFELHWRRLLRVPWTARRSKKSILKKINSKYALEGLMLKLQYFGHLLQKANSLKKILMLGKIEGKRRRGRQRMSRFDAITDSMDMSLSKLLELVMDMHAGMLQSMGFQTVGHDWTTELNWTELLLAIINNASIKIYVQFFVIHMFSLLVYLYLPNGWEVPS